MRLYACGATDTVPDISITDDELGIIIIRAAEQEILDVVLIALDGLSKKTGLKISPELMAKCKTKLKWLLLESSAKRDFLTHTFDALEEAGIYPLILKGDAVSRFYAIPESRVSNDIDILVDGKDEKESYAILERLGYAVTPRSEFSNHATCTHPSIGIVELHSACYEEITADVVFGALEEDALIREEPLTFTLGDHTFRTLGVTDHLIFLFLHMIQHFIKSGASVRQLMDILLYIKHNRDVLDTDRVKKILTDLRYISIYNTALTIGTVYFGLDSGELTPFERVGDETVKLFLDDIEKGGWLGAKRERDGICLRYVGAHRAESTEEFEKDMAGYQTVRIKKAIFPDRRRIYRRFPFAKKSILLLPVGWICWLFYGLKLAGGGTLSSRTPQNFELAADTAVRVSLFKQLGII